jgi:tetratricopeptide (TPR) repeat protein
MGDVQGNFFVPNLGEKNAAEESYRKALAMAESLWRSRPADATGKLQVADVYLKLGDVLANRREALDQYNKARGLYESMTPDRAVENAMMRAWDKTGATQGQLGDAAGALESYQRALNLARHLKRPEAIEILKERVAYFSALNGDTAGAEEAVLAAIRSYQDSADNPRNEAAAFRVLAEVQRRAGKIDAALESTRKSLKITADLLAEDPQDKLHQIDHEQGLIARIELLAAGGRKAEEREETARFLRLMKPWIGQSDVTDYQVQDYVRLLLNTSFPEFQDPAAALRYGQKLAGMTREADPKALDLLARAYDRNDDPAHAIETERKALALLPPVAPGAKPSELRTTLESNLRQFQTRLTRKN